MNVANQLKVIQHSTFDLVSSRSHAVECLLMLYEASPWILWHVTCTLHNKDESSNTRDLLHIKDIVIFLLDLRGKFTQK